MTDLDELERLAREAKEADDAASAEAGDDESVIQRLYRRNATRAILEFACDPTTILALVERVRSKERESAVEEWLPWARDRYGSQTCDQERADRAEAELKALQERAAEEGGGREGE